MNLEIERKFLVKKSVWNSLTKPKGEYLRQGYISTDPEKTIRIRLTETKAFITIKGKNKGIVRQEFEYSIPQDDAKDLLNNFTSTSLEKIRYKITHKEKTWEIDEFLGDNEGLLVAEIELQSLDERFELPDWIAQEVSDDKRYFNSYLSEHPYKSWK